MAWERAVQKAAGGKITAAIVRSAVRQLGLDGSKKSVAREPAQSRAERRRLIDEAVGQLLVLLSQKAPHELLTEKVEALHRQIRALFPVPRKG